HHRGPEGPPPGGGARDRALAHAARPGARERGGGRGGPGLGAAGGGPGDPRPGDRPRRGHRPGALGPAHLGPARPHAPQARARPRAAAAAGHREGGPRRSPPPRRAVMCFGAAAPLRAVTAAYPRGGRRPAAVDRTRSTMASLSQWVQGARPRTLPAALAPVAAG